MASLTLPERFLLSPPRSYDESHIRRVNTKLANPDSLKAAAVLIGLVKRPQGYHIVFTQRAAHLRHHPGQVAFPGGRYESALDEDLIATAIRETEEETGIRCSRKNILGKLPTLPTISGYIVQPYLSIVDADYEPAIDSNEVATLFEAPADYVLNPRNIKAQKFLLGGHFHTIYSVSFQGYSIWGATAQMLKVLSNQIWH